MRKMAKKTKTHQLNVCPKCAGNWIGDIGYDIWQCFECDETWKQKSKTGLES